MVTTRQRQARVLRRTRRVHRYSGVALFAFFAVVGVTSVLLGWKKDAGWIMPPTSKVAGVELSDFLPLDSLRAVAQGKGKNYVHNLPLTVDRLDVRPGKGIVKVLFNEEYYEMQLNGATGEVLSFGKRRSDLYESIHDGSILDEWFGTGGIFKLVYSTVLGLALLVFTVSGFWLWYGPKRMRR